MANFVICVDADADRRQCFIEAAVDRLPPFAGLMTGAIGSQGFGAAWAVGPHAPFAQVSDDEGTTIVLGEIIAQNGDRLTPEALRLHWSEQAAERITADFDGYYAACVYRPGRCLLVGADLLGLFPIYYYESADVILVGSSPETFASHPVFRAAFNPAGLAGILLTNGLFAGETLFAGVKRLSPGHRLLWEPGAASRELPSYLVPLTDRYRDLTFSRHLDILDEAMTAAVARQAPAGRRYTLLLSGGLDSRTLGGYLAQAGREVVALSLGARADIEVRCAIPVARALGIRQHIRELDATRYVDYARQHTTWEHGAAGGSLIMKWGMRGLLMDLPPAVVTGSGLDWVLGGHAPTEPDLSFDSFFRYQNAWGLPPSLLRSLLRGDVFRDVVRATVEQMRKTYTGYSDVESRRAWSFSLYHRQRFHIGSDAWRLAFTAWPIQPATDKALLEIGGGMPPASVADRRAQFELLRTRFPELAALPLDRNSRDTTPLQPNLRWLLTRRLLGPAFRIREALARRGWKAPERRRFYRVYDINGPGWVAVRREAEPHRDLAYNFFEKRALDELLPHPDVPVRFRDGITDVAGIKTIIGFILWARDHLG